MYMFNRTCFEWHWLWVATCCYLATFWEIFKAIWQLPYYLTFVILSTFFTDWYPQKYQKWASGDPKRASGSLRVPVNEAEKWQWLYLKFKSIYAPKVCLSASTDMVPINGKKVYVFLFLLIISASQWIGEQRYEVNEKEAKNDSLHFWLEIPHIRHFLPWKKEWQSNEKEAKMVASIFALKSLIMSFFTMKTVDITSDLETSSGQQCHSTSFEYSSTFYGMFCSHIGWLLKQVCMLHVCIHVCSQTGMSVCIHVCM